MKKLGRCDGKGEIAYHPILHQRNHLRFLQQRYIRPLLVQNIAEMGCMEFDETHPATLLPELALAAEKSGADGRAYRLRRMAEQPIYDVDDDTSAAVS